MKNKPGEYCNVCYQKWYLCKCKKLIKVWKKK